MPFFAIRITETISKEFIIKARNRGVVENLTRAQIEQIAAQDLNAPEVDESVHIRTDSDSGTSIYDTDIDAWNAAKKQ